MTTKSAVTEIAASADGDAAGAVAAGDAEAAGTEATAKTEARATRRSS